MFSFLESRLFVIMLPKYLNTWTQSILIVWRQGRVACLSLLNIMSSVFATLLLRLYRKPSTKLLLKSIDTAAQNQFVICIISKGIWKVRYLDDQVGAWYTSNLSSNFFNATYFTSADVCHITPASTDFCPHNQWLEFSVTSFSSHCGCFHIFLGILFWIFCLDCRTISIASTFVDSSFFSSLSYFIVSNHYNGISMNRRKKTQATGILEISISVNYDGIRNFPICIQYRSCNFDCIERYFPS